jgi:hypothetical protein
VDTVTVADFTAETFFSDELWEEYLERPEVKALATKDRIKDFECLLRTNLLQILDIESAVLSES